MARTGLGLGLGLGRGGPVQAPRLPWQAQTKALLAVPAHLPHRACSRLALPAALIAASARSMAAAAQVQTALLEPDPAQVPPPIAAVVWVPEQVAVVVQVQVQVQW